MKLSIDIDDQELKEVVEKGVKNLGKITITKLAKEAVSQYLSEPKNIESIVFRTGGGYYNSQKDLRPEVVEMLGNSFTEEEVESYRKKLLATVGEKGDEIILKTLISIFSDMLMSDNFKQNLQHSLYGLSTGINDTREKLGMGKWGF